MSLHNKRRGNAAIFALTLVPLIGFGALSVDVGMQRMTAVQVQAAAESASNAGAAYLDGTSDGLQAAITKAKVIGNLNYVYGGNFTIVDANVQLGIYDEGDGSFTAVASTYDPPGDVNAVRVTPDTTNDAILAKFAFGVDTLTSAGAATAIAQTGGVAKYVDCYLPFAIPYCHFENLEDGDNPPPMMLELGSINTVGWGMPNQSPNTNSINDLLLDQCGNGTAETCDNVVTDPDTGVATCDTDGTSDVNLSNGQNAAAVTYAASLINGAAITGNPAEPWPTAYFGDAYAPRGADATGDGEADSNPTTSSNSSLITSARWGWNLNGVVPIIAHGCGDGFTGSAPIVGWTYAYIYDGKTAGSGGKNIWMQFDFINEYDVGYGQCTGDCQGNVPGGDPPIQVF